MANTLQFCQFLSSHLCHEIAGPISAINNSLDLINSTDSDIKINATKLIKDANNELVKKVKFYSHLYSITQHAENISFEFLQKLCLGYFDNNKITLDFIKDQNDASFEPELSKAILCLILVAYKNLMKVKGGLLKVSYQNVNNSTLITIKATSTNLPHEPEIIKVLKGDESVTINFFNCYEYYIAMLNKKMDYQLLVTQLNNTIEYTYVI